MKHLLTIIAFIFLLFTVKDSNAQTAGRVINGKIISFEESFPLEGVSVAIKGRNYFTGTQADGTFSLDVLPGDKILIISLAEYQTMEINITADKTYDVILKRVGNDVQVIKTGLLLLGKR